MDGDRREDYFQSVTLRLLLLVWGVESAFPSSHRLGQRSPAPAPGFPAPERLAVVYLAAGGGNMFSKLSRAGGSAPPAHPPQAGALTASSKAAADNIFGQCPSPSAPGPPPCRSAGSGPGPPGRRSPPAARPPPPADGEPLDSHQPGCLPVIPGTLPSPGVRTSPHQRRPGPPPPPHTAAQYPGL